VLTNNEASEPFVEYYFNTNTSIEDVINDNEWKKEAKHRISAARRSRCTAPCYRYDSYESMTKYDN
jgi:hypothetical protein